MPHALCRLPRPTYLLLCLLIGTAAAASAADVTTARGGGEIDLARQMAPGKYVLVDFYAEWCGPCKRIEPVLNALAERFPDKLAIRRIDIVRWGSPVARQHRIDRVPYLRLYDGTGKLLVTGARESMEEARRLLERSAGAPLADDAPPPPAAPEPAERIPGWLLPFLLVAIPGLFVAWTVRAR